MNIIINLVYVAAAVAYLGGSLTMRAMMLGKRLQGVLITVVSLILVLILLGVRFA